MLLMSDSYLDMRGIRSSNTPVSELQTSSAYGNVIWNNYIVTILERCIELKSLRSKRIIHLTSRPRICLKMLISF